MGTASLTSLMWKIFPGDLNNKSFFSFLKMGLKIDVCLEGCQCFQTGELCRVSELSGWGASLLSPLTVRK